MRTTAPFAPPVIIEVPRSFRFVGEFVVLMAGRVVSASQLAVGTVWTVRRMDRHRNRRYRGR